MVRGRSKLDGPDLRPYAGVPGPRVPFYGWAVVAVGTLATFCSGPGQSFLFSLFVDPIILDTGLSRTGVSALYAVGTGVSAAMVAIVGRLVDRFGARLMLATIALALGAACFGMAAATGPLGVFLGFAALRALGQGSLPVTATLLAAQWFVRYRGRAMAVLGLGFAASNAVLPPLTRGLIDGVGWRGAYVALGAMVWVLIVPAALLIVRNRPEDIGRYPDGATASSAQERPEDEADPRRDRRKVLRSSTFWLLAAPLAVPSFVTTALIFHQISIFEERGLDTAVAAGVFVPYAIASAGASTAAGFVVDRVGPKRLFLGNLVVLLAALVALPFITSSGAAVLYATILGAASGTQAVIGGVTWAHYYGRRGLGRVQGAAMMVTTSGAALGPLPVAVIQQRSGSYAASFGFLIVLLVAAWITAALVRPRPALATGR